MVHDTADIDFSLKSLFFQVNLEATFTLSWIDTRYKPNKDFFVGDNKLDFFNKILKLNCIISFTIIDPDDVKLFWTPDIIIDQAKDHDYSKLVIRIMMVTMKTQVKAARMPTLMVEPVSIRLYDDSRVLFHENVAMHYFHDDQ